MEKNNAKKKAFVGLSIALAVVGVVALYLFYSVFTVRDKARAQAQMQQMTEFIGRQCIRYDDIHSESETKSLIAMIDKVNLIRRELADDRAMVSELLAEYVRDQRLTGIIVTDNETGNTIYSCEDGLTPDVWTNILTRFASVADSQQKCYAERLVGSDGYYYDYVMAAKPGGSGIVLCYLKQDVKSVVGTSMSVSTLLEDFRVSDMSIVVTDGENVVASTNGDLVGKPVESCTAVSAIRNSFSTEELVRFSDGGETYYAMRGRVKGNYIYTYLTTKEVFSERTLALAYFAVVYVMLVGTAYFVYGRAIHAKEAEQMKAAEAYNAEVECLAKEAMRANEAKTDFLRRMSHDIRTPINGIQGLMRIGNYYADDLEKQKYCREKVMETSGYLLELVNDVLDMSKLDSGEAMWKDEYFDIKALLSEVASMLAYQASEHGVTLHYREGKILTPGLYGGAVPLKRICVNLLNNAVKYNKDGGSITFSAEQLPFGEDPHRAVFRITCSDTGIGMSEEFQKRMFEPFTQENVSYKSSWSGTGLGLAIVKRLVDRMSGTIEVHSAQGEGTTFVLTLPFLVAESAVAPEKEPDIPKAGKQELGNVKILLVEDNALNMEISEFMLETAGATVVKATNGDEAVKVFAASAPGEIRVILMDVMMPVMNGLDATRKIRALDRSDAMRVPIIAMTANAYADDVERTMAAGMNDHLAKPVDMRQLIDTVKKFI